MSSDIAIKVDHLSKRYIIGERQSYLTLRDQILEFAKHPFGLGLAKENKADFWALKDVSFEIKRGDVVGIIGRNGAGKSTLLKIISRITEPTQGKVELRGRVASLLEVGTGFSPELTGRENIYLNGSILGMTKKEIDRKFDEIVEFAGISQFLDTPVKRYSSGMYVRLAFAVAAHLDSEILIVDEVLAVGDAEFQRKCLKKMSELTRGSERTVLFVSHNMGAIQNLCTSTVWLDKGAIKIVGKTESVINQYLNQGDIKACSEYEWNNQKKGSITKIKFTNHNKEISSIFPINESSNIEVEYRINQEIKGALLCLLFYSGDELLLASSTADDTGKLIDFKPGFYSTIFQMPEFLFNTGRYNLEVSIQRPYAEMIDQKRDLSFEIISVNDPRTVIYNSHVLGKMASILKNSTKFQG